MATAKKIVSKKVTPVRPATRRPIAVRATGVQWLLGAKIAVAVAAFCIPLSAGTWTPDRWEIHKLIALLAAVTVAWFCYFVHYFRRPMTSWTWHPLDWLVLAVGAVSVVGTFTSLDWWTSLTGLQGSYVETLPAILGFLSVYFLSTKLFITSADRLVVWSSLLGGIGLALLVQLFQFSGFSVLPASLANDPLFSPLANSSLQVALLASVVATIGLLLWPKAQGLRTPVTLVIGEQDELINPDKLKPYVEMTDPAIRAKSSIKVIPTRKHLSILLKCSDSLADAIDHWLAN
jgi:hypothetical protein